MNHESGFVKNVVCNLDYFSNNIDIPLIHLNKITEIICIFLSYEIEEDREFLLSINETLYQVILKKGKNTSLLPILNNYFIQQEEDILFASKKDFLEDEKISLNIILDFKDESNLESCL